MDQMAAIQSKMMQVDEADRKKRAVLPREVKQLLNRDETTRIVSAGQEISDAVQQLISKDDELKIVFCGVNETQNKAKENGDLLCRVSCDKSAHLLDLLTQDPDFEKDLLKQSLERCDKDSDVMEKQSVTCTRTVSELRKSLKELDAK